MLPPERKEFVDEYSGKTVIRWTGSPTKDQHFYFTSPTVTLDNRWLVIMSERTGSPNIYAIDRENGGTIKQLSQNDKGLLRSYVYPQGGIQGAGLTGLSKASPCLDEVRGFVYWIQDDALWQSHIESGELRRLCDLPGGWYTAFNHVSPDGKKVAVPCTPPDVFPEQADGQWDQMAYLRQQRNAGKVTTQIYEVDVETGEKTLWSEIPFWVTHLNYDPTRNDRLTFNSESLRFEMPRIWCLEPDGSFHPLYDQPKTTSVNHENFSPTGEFVTYHGTDYIEVEEDGAKRLQPQVDFVAARKWDGELVYHLTMPRMTGTTHVTTRRDGRSFVTDGVGNYVSVLTPEGDHMAVEHVCLHATDPSARHQDSHAHPLEVPAGGSIVFTSDRAGTPNVYEVIL